MLTALGSSPFLLDAMLGWAIVPRRLAVLVGQFPTDIPPQSTVTTTNLELADRSLAGRFFFIDRSIGAQALITPTTHPQRVLNLTLAMYNHTIEEGPLSYNQYNPDLGFMYAAGIDYNHGPTYGAREGDFPWSTTARIRLSLRAMYADVERGRSPGTVGLRGHIFFTNAQLGFKYKGFALVGAAMFRLQKFIDLNPDILDFGMHVQASYFVIKHFLAIVARYSQIWPDFNEKGDPRNLPKRSVLQSKGDILEPFTPLSTKEAGGGLRLFPTKDPQLNIILVYLWRDIDSVVMLQVNTWL
jgi:hypothetical protein